MSDEVVAGLITRLQPAFYFIGLSVVLGIVSFGGTIVNLFWKKRETESTKLEETLQSIKRALESNTISIVQLETKIDMLSERYDKDLQNLGNKLRNLQV